MLASLDPPPVAQPGFVYEPKYDGIRALIDMEDDLEVCGEAEDQHDAMEMIKQDQPDLVLVDISLKNSNGLNLLKEIGQNHPDIMTLAVSMHDEYTYAIRCLKAGAKGYIMKQEGTEKILDAIRAVLDGKTYLSPEMTQAAVDQRWATYEEMATRSAADFLPDPRRKAHHPLEGHGTPLGT